MPVEGHADDRTLGLILAQQAQRFGIKGVDLRVEIGHELRDGDIVKVGRGSLKVLHVPGHSQGSIALYDEADRFVIVGDTLFEGSIGRTDLMGGNHRQLVDAIKNKLLTLPRDTMVYSGHGDPTTIGREADSNPYLV